MNTKGASMYGIIYCAHNTITDKVYIGQTIRSLDYRRSSHRRTDSKFRSYFHNSLHKYGFDNFNWTILYYAQNKKSLNDAEVYWINNLDSTNKSKGYNLKTGGSNGSPNAITRKKISETLKGRKLSAEVCKKLSEANKGQIPWIKGRVHSDEAKKKIREAATGRKHTDEAKRKISEGHKGKTFSEKTKKKMSDAAKKRHRN